jgi:tRNA-Thr(GGU) m(6)t(6)A37 methyltransferase TsaA
MDFSKNNFQFSAIGLIHSPYREKFGIPRQPGLAAIDAVIELLPPYANADAVQGLEQFSHLWLTFVFHAVRREWKPLVRPPRLGGNEKIGVFATRSTHRPNPIGLSVVELLRVDVSQGIHLHIRGADLLDDTPILDIKPYIPYADCVVNARAGYAQSSPQRLTVEWQLDVANVSIDGATKRMITEVLSFDPRPAYQYEPERIYGMHIGEFNVRFRIDAQVVQIVAVKLIEDAND